MNGEGGNRHVGRRAAIFILVGLGLFVAAILQAGVIRDAFRAERELLLLLPPTGGAGLAPGSPVEILGARAGRVESILVRPGQAFHAVLKIDAAMSDFVRRDSIGVIRKQFGIAGAAFVEIRRGSGPAVDWDYAVIEASTERAPTDDIGQLVDDLRAKIFPVLDDAGRGMKALASTLERIDSPDGEVRVFLGELSAVASRVRDGEGVVGRLLSDEKLAGDIETAVRSVAAQVVALEDLFGSLTQLAARLERGEGAAGRLLTDETLANEISGIAAGLNARIAQMEAVLNDAATASGALARTAATIGEAAPPLVAQAQTTLATVASLAESLARGTPDALAAVTRAADAAPALAASAQETLAAVASLSDEIRAAGPRRWRRSATPPGARPRS